MRIAAVASAGVASKATAARWAARFVHRAAQPCIFTANAKPPAWRLLRRQGGRGGGLERRPHCTNCGYCLARKRNYYIKDT